MRRPCTKKSERKRNTDRSTDQGVEDVIIGGLTPEEMRRLRRLPRMHLRNAIIAERQDTLPVTALTEEGLNQERTQHPITSLFPLQVSRQKGDSTI